MALMSKNLLNAFGAINGAISLITHREATGDRSVTLDRFDKAVLFSRYPNGSFARKGGAPSNGNPVHHSFLVNPHNSANGAVPRQVNVVHPKRAGSELRLYEAGSGLNFRSGDYFYVYVREGESRPFIGTIGATEISAIEVAPSEDQTLANPQVTSDDKAEQASAIIAEDIDSLLAQPASVPVLPIEIDFSTVLVDSPKPQSQNNSSKGKGGGAKKVNYKQKADANDTVGALGEDFALAYEQWRLRDHPELLKKIKHVSKEDDTLGYDIESFELDGTPRFVEVKGTLGPLETRFFISAAELACAEVKGDQYVLLRAAHLADNPKCCEIRYPFTGKLDFTAATYSVGFTAELPAEPNI